MFFDVSKSNAIDPCFQIIKTWNMDGKKANLYLENRDFYISIVDPTSFYDSLEKTVSYQNIQGIPSNLYLLPKTSIKVFFKKTFIQVHPLDDKTLKVYIYQQGKGGMKQSFSAPSLQNNSDNNNCPSDENLFVKATKKQTAFLVELKKITLFETVFTVPKVFLTLNKKLSLATLSPLAFPVDFLDSTQSQKKILEEKVVSVVGIIQHFLTSASQIEDLKALSKLIESGEYKKLVEDLSNLFEKFDAINSDLNKIKETLIDDFNSIKTQEVLGGSGIFAEREYKATKRFWIGINELFLKIAIFLNVKNAINDLQKQFIDQQKALDKTIFSLTRTLSESGQKELEKEQESYFDKFEQNQKSSNAELQKKLEDIEKEKKQVGKDQQKKLELLDRQYKNQSFIYREGIGKIQKEEEELLKKEETDLHQIESRMTQKIIHDVKNFCENLVVEKNELSEAIKSKLLFTIDPITTKFYTLVTEKLTQLEISESSSNRLSLLKTLIDTYKNLPSAYENPYEWINDELEKIALEDSSSERHLADLNSRMQATE